MRVSIVAKPALLAVKGRDALAVWQVHDGETLVGSFRIDLDRKLAAVGSDVSLLHEAGNFLQGSFAPDRSEILVKQLIGRRQDGFGGRRGTALRFGSGLLFANDGNTDRFGGAAMARIASHLTVSFEIVFVDGEHHLHHFARGYFCLLVVLVELHLLAFANMAVLAFDTERSGNELHGGKHEVRRNSLERLDVLELFFG